jgi:hypothetical protein
MKKATKYCDGLFRALGDGIRKACVMWSAIELRLLSSKGLSNHDNRGAIEDVSTATNTTEEAMHCIQNHVDSQAVQTERNVSIRRATNLQNTITAKNAITLLLKEMISVRFNQNLPQGGN